MPKSVVDFKSSTIKKELDLLGLTWDEALHLTKDRSEWRDLCCEIYLRDTIPMDAIPTNKAQKIM